MYNNSGDGMQKYMDSFIEYITLQRHYSNDTIINYTKDLDNFYNYLDSKSISSLNKVDYNVIRGYLMLLHEKEYSKKTISRHISTLKSFFKYLLGEHYIKDNPTSLITSPKLDKKLPQVLYYEDLDKLLNIPNDDNIIGLRNSLILELLYSTGIRVSELVNIKVSDIDKYNTQINIFGKGSKERIVIYGKVCEEKLNKYLNKRNELDKYKSEYLLLNNQGRKLTTRGIRYIIDKIIKEGGLKFHISPHVLRHTFATHMLNEGADLKSVQELLGHENLSTTQIYTHVSNERLRNVYLNSHPRAKK